MQTWMFTKRTGKMLDEFESPALKKIFCPIRCEYRLAYRVQSTGTAVPRPRYCKLYQFSTSDV